MNEIKRDYQHRRERDVFYVEERVGVEARVQQKHQHSEQRRPSAAKRPICEYPASKAARDKEQMGKQMAHDKNVAAVLQSERPLRQ